MLKLQKKIKHLEAEINSNKLLLVNYKQQLKKKLLTPATLSMAFLLCFFAGCYLEYKQAKNNYSFIDIAKKMALTAFTFYSKFITFL